MSTLSSIQLCQRLVVLSIFASAFILSSCTRTTNRAPIQPFTSPIINRDITAQKLMPAKQLPLKTALLVPLTGQHAKLGSAVEQACELALFVKKASNFDLAIYDTQSTAVGAQEAMKKAITDKCTAVVGPIFSDDIMAIKTLARAQATPLFSLSNNTAIADNNTYVLGLSPLDQSITILDYAQQHNVDNILTVLPQNQLGQAIAGEIKKNALQTQIIFYDPKQLSSLQPITQAIQKGHIKGLFIPEGGAALARIISALVYSDINLKIIQLLGSSLWDEPATKGNPSLQGAWITTPDPVHYERYESEFKKNYAVTPPKVASIGYDAIALLITAKKHFDTQALTPANITDARGYLGANGIFKLLSNGSVQRTYSIMKLQSSKLIKLDVATSKAP